MKILIYGIALHSEFVKAEWHISANDTKCNAVHTLCSVWCRSVSIVLVCIVVVVVHPLVSCLIIVRTFSITWWSNTTNQRIFLMRNESNLNQIEWSLVPALWKKCIAHKKSVDSAFLHLYLRWNCAGCVDPETYAMKAFIRLASSSSSWMCGEIKMVHMRFYLSGHAIILGQCIKDWIASMKFKLKCVECATSQNQYNKQKKESTTRWTMDGGPKKKMKTRQWMTHRSDCRRHAFPIYMYVPHGDFLSISFSFLLHRVSHYRQNVQRAHTVTKRAWNSERRPHDEANLRPLKEN